MKKKLEKTFVALSLAPLLFFPLFYLVAVPLMIGSEQAVTQGLLFTFLVLGFVLLPLAVLIFSIYMIRVKKLRAYAWFIAIVNVLWFVLLVWLSIVGRGV